MTLSTSWKLGGIAVLALLALGSWWLHQRAHAEKSVPYLSYTATGQVTALQPLGTEGCRVEIRLHQWVSLSDGFTLAEIPQRGQVYTLRASPEQCVALEVALASGDQQNPGHIYYQAQQLSSGEWHVTQTPRLPLGCGGL
ncbi:hypothetical protein [Meiothermus rufus]|uniref:hypothetical protein n=1 Tax=Meiothermus rufus TaxID=604332 RepID=UPI0004850AAD|nr:hypothetical protein [Meiothermus rufus]